MTLAKAKSIGLKSALNRSHNQRAAEYCEFESRDYVVIYVQDHIFKASSSLSLRTIRRFHKKHRGSRLYKSRLTLERIA